MKDTKKIAVHNLWVFMLMKSWIELYTRLFSHDDQSFPVTLWKVCLKLKWKKMYAVFFVLHRKQNYGGTVEELG